MLLTERRSVVSSYEAGVDEVMRIDSEAVAAVVKTIDEGEESVAPRARFSAVGDGDDIGVAAGHLGRLGVALVATSTTRPGDGCARDRSNSRWRG